MNITLQQAAPPAAVEILELGDAHAQLEDVVGAQRHTEHAVRREVAIRHLAAGIAHQQP
jgi:hypothetical protein